MAGVPPVPGVAGVLDPSQVAATAAAIARVQQTDGGIPWAVGEHIDVWNHVESAMALLVGGQRDAAEAAYDWCLRGQRPDGSWPMKIVGDTVEDAGVRSAIDDAVTALGDIGQVEQAVSPFDENVTGAVSEDQRAALISIQFDGAQTDITAATISDVEDAEANLANARGQRELAEQECARTKQLLDKGAITRSAASS